MARRGAVLFGGTVGIISGPVVLLGLVMSMVFITPRAVPFAHPALVWLGSWGGVLAVDALLYRLLSQRMRAAAGAFVWCAGLMALLLLAAIYLLLLFGNMSIAADG